MRVVTLRVAMVGLRAPWGASGGVESAVAALAPRLVALGCHVTVYCRGRYNPHGDASVEGVRLVDVPTVYRRSAEALVHTALAAPLAAARHDVVHLHACGPGLFAGVPPLLRRASVVTLHGLDWERDKWGPAARAALRAGAWTAGRRASHLVGVSRSVAAWLRAHARAPVACVPNGVGAFVPEPWDPAAFPGLRPGGYLLFVGRLVPEKDLLTLVRAAARARPRLPLAIVGGAAYTDAYAARLRAEAPPGTVFPGPRFGREKAMLLAHARAFAFPSRVEGLPIALLEAMAAGLPVVASDIDANREALGDVGGWRVPVGDVGAWARALGEVAEADPARLRALGAEGARRARARFDWDAIARRTLEVYAAAVEGRAVEERAEDGAWG